MSDRVKLVLAWLAFLGHVLVALGTHLGGAVGDLLKLQIPGGSDVDPK